MKYCCTCCYKDFPSLAAIKAHYKEQKKLEEREEDEKNEGVGHPKGSDK